MFQKWSIPILVAAAVAVLAAIVYLAVGAMADTPVEIDDSALAKAKAAHTRLAGQRAAAPTESAPPRSIPRPPKVDSPEVVADEPERIERDLANRRLAPTPARPTIGNVVGKGDELAELQQAMDKTNRLYDRQDYEGAIEAALEVLEDQPKNVRMLRVVVSSSCILAEPEQAKKYYKDLPERDQRQMQRRCQRYSVEFDE